MSTTKKHDWLLLKEKFFTDKTNRPHMTLKLFAEENDIDYHYFRNRVSAGKWLDEYEDRIVHRDNLINEELKKRHELALQKIREDFASSEHDVRKRHEMAGRNLELVGLIALQHIDPKKLTETEARRYIETGQELQRRARGMPDTVFVDSTPPNSQHQFKSVEEQEKHHQRMRKLGAELLDYIEGHAQRVEDDGKVVPLKRIGRK